MRPVLINWSGSLLGIDHLSLPVTCYRYRSKYEFVCKLLGIFLEDLGSK